MKSKRKSEALPIHIESLILNLCGEKVILDADLARIYGVSTKALNQAVKRNIDSFPHDRLIHLTKSQWASLRSQVVTTKLPANHRSQIMIASPKGADPGMR